MLLPKHGNLTKKLKSSRLSKNWVVSLPLKSLFNEIWSRCGKTLLSLILSLFGIWVWSSIYLNIELKATVRDPITIILITNVICNWIDSVLFSFVIKQKVIFIAPNDRYLAAYIEEMRFEWRYLITYGNVTVMITRTQG